MRYSMMVLMAALLGGCQHADGGNPAAPAAPSPPTAGAREVPIEAIGRMQVAVDRAIAFAGQHGPDHVLVAFDLDSTLLRDPRRTPDLDRLEETEPERFRQVERTVMYLKSLEPTEAALTKQLDRLRTAGIPVYLITARGRDMRDMTLREMAANDIVLPPPPECGPPLCEGRGAISADALYQAAEQALGSEELAQIGFARGRDITVWDGIVMAAGLDKGVLLRTLGASLGRPIKAYVFVDDAEKNVRNVARAAATMAEDVAIFHYDSAERTQPARSQAEADRDWAEAERAICRAFAPRWCR